MSDRSERAVVDRADDRILIRDLLLRGIVGINPDERVKPQDILVNLVLHADTRRAGESDDIADCVNYRSVTKAVIAHVETSSWRTVEKLAAEIARIAVVDFGVARVEVRVEKPTALRFARSVGVEITRTRADFPS
jgi:FolB domain-containing protein